MYLQITTRCNMTCAHCCMAATHKGDDMSTEVFMEALMYASRLGELITIGGGEPTTHKQFFDFLDKAIEFSERGRIEMPPLVITNGKLKSKALKLLDYVERGRAVYVELSQDEYHDPIDAEVVRRFSAHQAANDRNKRYGNYGESSNAGIRTVSNIIAVGRAADLARGIVTSTEQFCCCEDVLVDPNGDLWSCGCKHTKIGTVWDRDALDGYERDRAHYGGFDLDVELLAA